MYCTPLICCTLLSVTASFVQGTLNAKWSGYKQTHAKAYASAKVEQLASKAFQENNHYIHQHAKNASFTMGHNSLADLSFEEFLRTKATGFRMNDPEFATAQENRTEFKAMPQVDLPTYIDWRDFGYVTKVHDQGECNACYAFSAAGALEAQVARLSGNLVELSVQNILDCTAGKGNLGCDGGRMNVAFQYVKRNGGIDDGISYPYEGAVKECRYNAANNAMSDSKVKYFTAILKNKEDDIKRTLATIGPVSASIDAGHRSLQLYTGGIYEEPQCTENLSHAVLIVGYGSENGKDFWIIKNSWGERWGEDGYFRLLRGKNMCGITNMASYPFVQ